MEPHPRGPCWAAPLERPPLVGIQEIGDDTNSGQVDVIQNEQPASPQLATGVEPIDGGHREAVRTVDQDQIELVVFERRQSAIRRLEYEPDLRAVDAVTLAVLLDPDDFVLARCDADVVSAE